MGNWFTDGINDIKSGVEDGFNDVKDWGEEAWEDTKDFAEDSWETAKDVGEKAGKVGKDAYGVAQKAITGDFEGAADKWGDLEDSWDDFEDSFNSAKDKIEDGIDAASKYASNDGDGGANNNPTGTSSGFGFGLKSFAKQVKDAAAAAQGKPYVPVNAGLNVLKSAAFGVKPTSPLKHKDTVKAPGQTLKPIPKAPAVTTAQISTPAKVAIGGTAAATVAGVIAAIL